MYQAFGGFARVCALCAFRFQVSALPFQLFSFSAFQLFPFDFCLLPSAFTPRSDFVISAENDLAHLGCLSGQFVDQSRTGFRVAESGLG